MTGKHSPIIILRRPAVLERTGLSRSCLYELVKKHEFPQQVKLGARSVGWLENEVNAFIDSKIAQRNLTKEAV